MIRPVWSAVKRQPLTIAQSCKMKNADRIVRNGHDGCAVSVI